MFYLSDLKTSVYLSLIVAHGDEKVLFPFCGDTYGFPNKSWSGRMYFLLALQHPKQRNSPSLLHSSIRTKRVYCIPEEFTFSWKCFAFKRKEICLRSYTNQSCVDKAMNEKQKHLRRSYESTYTSKSKPGNMGQEGPPLVSEVTVLMNPFR